MRQISGEGNWKIQYRNEEEGIVILRGITADRNAVLPSDIEGIPVIAIGDYGLNARNRSFDGECEEVEIRGFRPPGDGGWSNYNVESLTLPKGLRDIGSYAFMGMWHLKTLEAWEEDVHWGLSPWMGCRNLHQITLHRQQEQGWLAHLCSEVNRELEVSIWEGGRLAQKVLFPEYMELAEENTPARQFNPVMEGIGYPYHFLFQEGRLPMREYDLLWDTVTVRGGELTETLEKIAWWRLCYPMQLSESFEEAYLAYVREHQEAILQQILTSGDGAELQRFVEVISPSQEVLRAGCDWAREQKQTKSLAVLMAKLDHQEAPAGRRKQFAL